MLEEQEKVNSQLLAERSNHLANISELNDEVRLLKFQLENIKKQVKMMITSTSTLDKILEGQVKENPNGIGFDYNPLNQKQQNRHFAYALEDHGMIRKEKQDISSVVATGRNIVSSKKIMLQHSEKHHYPRNKKVTRTWICHYCKRKGHIRPLCFKLHGYHDQSGHKSRDLKRKNVKKNWMPKCNNVGLMVHTSLGTSSSDIWYFDSGCSRHMIGEKYFFDNLKSSNTGNVIFGDGSKGRVQGIGNICSDESPKLEDVFLVKGLVSNLISISQLYDQGLEVKFNRTECFVTNQEGKVLMRGIRSKNNFYKWISLQQDQFLEQAKMLVERLEHQKIRKGYNSTHSDNLNNWRRILLKENHINKQNHSIRNPAEMESSTKNPLLDECTRILKKIEKLRHRLGISLQKKLKQLTYDRRAIIFPISLSLVVHAISGSFFRFLLQLPTKRNHLTHNPSLHSSLSKFLKTIYIPSLITKLHHFPSVSEFCLSHQFTMKTKSSIPLVKKTVSDADASSPIRVKPISTVAPALIKKKNTLKPVANKKSMKKCDSKNAQAETSIQEGKKNKGKEELKDLSDVSTHAEEKSTSGPVIGNPDETLISNIPDDGRKLGLEDLNDTIDSTENMDIDAGNETNVNDSVCQDPDNIVCPNPDIWVKS